MLPRTLLSIPFLRTPTLTLLRRTLATPSSPPPPSSPSSSSLPPSIDQALRRSPVLMKLADDELFCKSFRTTGETMYSHGGFYVESEEEGVLSPMRRENADLSFLFGTNLTGLNGAESIGEKFSHLFSSSPALQNAIAEMRASTRRLEVSDEVSLWFSSIQFVPLRRWSPIRGGVRVGRGRLRSGIEPKGAGEEKRGREEREESSTSPSPSHLPSFPPTPFLISSSPKTYPDTDSFFALSLIPLRTSNPSCRLSSLKEVFSPSLQLLRPRPRRPSRRRARRK